jgi:hypothetical protein
MREENQIAAMRELRTLDDNDARFIFREALVGECGEVVTPGDRRCGARHRAGIERVLDPPDKCFANALRRVEIW